MIEHVELKTAQKLIVTINDYRNQQAQREAISMRDRWLVEAAAGTLQMSAEARAALEETRGPSDAEISKLKDEGFRVHPLVDTDRPVFAWHRPSSGESQADVGERQPYRSTERQAWADCRDYATLNVPSLPNPDWLAK